MRPILLMGHERSLTKIKYNRDGDLLFSVSKDSKPSVWYSHNGERLGSFIGHNGAVWDLDISGDSKRLITGSADSSCRIWDVYTGKELYKWDTKTAVRSVSFSEGDHYVLFVTDATMGNPSQVHVYALSPETGLPSAGAEPEFIITLPKSEGKVSIARWGALGKTIITGHEDGRISSWDATDEGYLLNQVTKHTGQITDIQFAQDKSHFISASKDTSSHIFDAETLEVLKSYSTDRPVNAAAMSPIKSHIMLGGGQDAMNVTTTSSKAEKFEVRFFHLIFEEEIGQVKGHFGPVNTLAFHPDGKSYASGGEDGYIRVHVFDPDYYTFKYAEEE